MKSKKTKRKEPIYSVRKDHRGEQILTRSIDGVVTDICLLDEGTVEQLAKEHRDLMDWYEQNRLVALEVAHDYEQLMPGVVATFRDDGKHYDVLLTQGKRSFSIEIGLDDLLMNMDMKKLKARGVKCLADLERLLEDPNVDAHELRAKGT